MPVTARAGRRAGQVAAIQSLLDKYPTRLIDDEAILAQNATLPPRRRNALILRRSDSHLRKFERENRRRGRRKERAVGAVGLLIGRRVRISTP